MGLLSGSVVASTMYIADRLGLFKTLAEAGDRGLTIKEATTAGRKPGDGVLSERYLKECFSSLAAAGILEVQDAATEHPRFILPKAHIPVLADESSTYFAGGWLSMIRLLFSVSNDVGDCFVKPSADAPERGVPFSQFGEDFVMAMGRAHGPGFVTVLEQELGKVPGFLETLQRPGAIVADVGCGSGNVLLALAKKYPACRFYGYDVDAKSIAAAKEKLSAASIPNLVFEVRRAEELSAAFPPTAASEGGFDLIMTVDVIHDLPEPRVGLSNICKALKKDGIFIMLEPKASSHLEKNLGPRSAFLYGVSLHHCMTQSLANGGVGVGAAWGKEEANRAAIECGFSTFEDIEVGNHETAYFRLTKSKL
ncbi:hypothetical protein HDU97_010157 [Phlyctochytrium planicorne]|nr:hypothetical protein HDU97_010157 [Phlyctochytrium planicorne]